jgi:hypothetical protein
MAVLTYLAFLACVSWWQFRRVKTGRCGKGRAIGLYAIFAGAPALLYGAAFLVLAGMEELSGMSVIGELYARTMPFVLAGGAAVVALTSLVFALVLLPIRRHGRDAGQAGRT